jgi:hypothetical protein
MNHLKPIVFFCLAVIFSGCAAPQQMYHWGDYSKTLYESRKHPSEQSLAAHQQELEKIITESGRRNLRIPPGVHAELGYIYFQQNRKDLAVRNFEIEKQIYPESALLMERLENAARLAGEQKKTHNAAPARESTSGKTDKAEK